MRIARDAAVDRLHAGAQDHDAARRRRSGALRFAPGAAPRRLSLYVETTPDGTPLRQATRLEPRAGRGQSAARRDRRTLRRTRRRRAIRAWTDELRALWRLAQKLEAARGKTDVPAASTTVSRSTGTPRPDGRVAIVPRPRGSPLDKLIAELMIHVNSSWGKLLADDGRAGPVSHAAGRARSR